MDDREVGQGPRREDLAFGPEARRVAQVQHGHGVAGSSGHQHGMATALRRAPQVGLAVGGSMIAVRRLRNGWIVDDGRGNEWVAATVRDALDVVGAVLCEVEAREREAAGRYAASCGDGA